MFATQPSGIPLSSKCIAYLVVLGEGEADPVTLKSSQTLLFLNHYIIKRIDDEDMGYEEALSLFNFFSQEEERNKLLETINSNMGGRLNSIPIHLVLHVSAWRSATGIGFVVSAICAESRALNLIEGGSDV